MCLLGRNIAGGLGGVLLTAAAARADIVGPFDFSLLPAASGVDINMSCSVSAPSGTAIGNFDPTTNPGGTRTRPGTDGPFDPNDNVPVPITFAGESGDRVVRQATGGFRMSLDPAAATSQFSGLSANLINNGSASMPASILFLAADGFRTRNPDAMHDGGSPLQLPLTTGTLTALSISQAGSASGSLSPGPGPTQWMFTTTVLVNLSATFKYLGNAFSTTAAVAQPIDLSGIVTVSGSTASLSCVQPMILSNSINQATPVGPFPFELTTVDDPDNPAHLLLSLLVSNITTSLSGEFSIGADGVLVPGPGSAGLVGLGLVYGGLRRRRR